MRAASWIIVITGAMACGSPGCTQLAHRNETGAVQAPAAPHRTRLILKDGSYQLVMSYTVVGARVRFVSAERGGETEEVPLALVDLDATKRWETRHAAADSGSGQARPAPAIDPELLKEEADRAALAPEVAPDLRLAPEDNLLALDTFRGTPELVPLVQSDSEVSQRASHNVLRAVVNPLASTHQLVQLKGERAAVQIHVTDPALYLRLDDEQPASGQALTVDTHGASAPRGKPREPRPAEYVILRVNVREDARVVASFNTSALGTTRTHEDLIETETTVLPGGHWVKIVPREPLLIGEYVLMEVLGEREVNLGVWDFGVHPTAPENRDILQPEKKRLGGLEKRPRE